MKFWRIAGVILLVLILAGNCLWLAGCFGLGGGSEVKVVYTVTGSVGAGSLGKSGFRSSGVGDGLDEGEKVSFTPTSLKIRVKGVYLASHMVYRESAGGYTCPSGEPQIDVTTAPTWVDLALAGAFDPLLSLSASVPASMYGDYRGILLLYGEDDPPGGGFPECIIKVSGDITIDGSPYTFTDVEVPMGSTGIGLNMPMAATIDASHSPVVKVIFDIEKAAYLVKSATPPPSPMKVAVPGYSDVWLIVDNFVFAPYVGSNNPNVEKYNVTLGVPDFGDQSKWYVKMVTFADASNNLVAAGWQTVYNNLIGGGASANFEPGMLYFPVITHISGSIYSIEDDDSLLTGPHSRLAFPAFTLGSTHSGTLTYNGNSYSYTATKQ